MSANLVRSKSHFGRVEEEREALERIVDEQMDHLGNISERCSIAVWEGREMGWSERG